jgi:hypothetical protein
MTDKMPSFIELYTVYDNRTDKVICEGTWAEVEDYAENPGRYTVVSQANGMIVS